jgi:hypothetical protein
MVSYDIEMLWQCSTCQHRGNRGLKDRYCCNCGHKKDDSDSEYMPDDLSEAAALSGDDARRAGAGRDWVCQYCDSVQNQLNKCCGNCGATERGMKLQSRVEEAAYWSGSADAAAHAAVAAEAEEPFGQEAAQIFARQEPRWRLWMVVAAVMVAIAALLYWLFTPHIVTARVSALHWQHDTIIERYAVYPHEGFVPSLGSFEVMPLGLRHHHYEHVHVGSHRESYQDRYACGETCSTSPSYTTCSSNGNGTARCSKHGGSKSCSTKYCSRTAYRTVQDYEDVSRQQIWYAWKIWEWGYNRTITRSGTTSTTTWPLDEELRPARISDGEHERSSREASYKVTFKNVSDDDTYSIEPKTLGAFQDYSAGQSVKLKVTHAGSVEVLGTESGQW